MTVVLILLLVVIGVFFAMGRYSAGQPPLGLTDEQAFSCGAKPNCVSSQQGQAPNQAVQPFDLKSLENPEESIFAAVQATGGTVVAQANGLMSAEYKSKLFGFVDDVVIKIHPSNDHADIISRSRVGYSDFGVNRKRVEAIREALAN